MTSEPRVALLGDRYELLRLIGSGTAADVYRVRDRRSGVLRAAKVLKPENAAKPKVLVRFEDEFRILRTLHHPHLPEVYDYGWSSDGGRFLVMELVDGVPLDEFFRTNPGDIWAILYELCETLTFVHKRSLLHQDIKPSNILVKRTTAFGPDLPLVKLIDFGLTYRRDAGAAVELVGTPEYIAPEVVRGGAPLTNAVDYYSVGATLCELLTGQPPFVGAVTDVLHAHLESEPVIDDEAIEWAELYPHVRALLTKDPRARLEAFEELRRAVVSRLTGGIAELDRAYELARVERSSIAGKEAAEAWFKDADRALREDPKRVRALDICGRSGPVRDRLIDFVCSEGAIRGFQVARLGNRADAFSVEDQALRQVDRFSKAMARFAAGQTPTLLVIDGIERLTDDEAGFIRYLSTTRELGTEGQSRFLYAVVRGRGATNHALDSYLPSDRQSLELPADSESARTREDDEDARAHVLASGVLEGARSESRRRLLAYVAAHPAPVPAEWAREFARVSADHFADDLEQLATRHLVNRVAVDRSDALQATDDARAVVRGVVARKVVTEAHRDLASRLTSALSSTGSPHSSIYETIAHHHAAVGEERPTLVARIRAVKAAWRERSLSGVERLSQSSLEATSNSKAAHAKAARRYFAKQWVRALWERNQHTRAKQVIDDHILGHGDVIPPGLLPKYIRGIMDAKEPAAALEFVETIPVKGLTSKIKEQILLEKSLLFCQCARHHESLELLDGLSDSALLEPRDRYRVLIYKAMNATGLGHHDKVETLLKFASTRARDEGYNDEFVVMSAIRAQTRIIKGRPRESLSLIAETLRVARQNELYLRVNLLYRLAASAYQDLGQPRRAASAQGKAIALSSTLGLAQFEAISWMRLSEYERALGNFGNVIRHVEKARKVMGGSSYEADRAQLDLTKLHLYLWLNSPDLGQVIENATWISRTNDVIERGRHSVMMGTYWSDRGNWDRAQRCYAEATSSLRDAGHADNLITLARARLHLAFRKADSEGVVEERDFLNREKIRTSGSKNGQLERSIARLEIAFLRRVRRRALSDLCDDCMKLCSESTEATLRLEALSLLFRVFARSRRNAEADLALKQFFALLKTAVSNLEERHIAGLMDRLDLGQLTEEYELMERRNKASGVTSLVA